MISKDKIIGTVVNGSLILVGLTLQHPDGSATRVPLNHLMQIGFCNSQLEFNAGRIALKRNFKLNDVPMEISLDNTFKQINNTLTVVAKTVDAANQDKGFVVETGLGRQELTAEELARYTALFKPVNFVVARRQDTGKAYITAKEGSINNLPVVMTSANQLAQRTYKKNVVTQAQAADLSFYNLVQTIDSMNGIFVVLPGIKYDANSKAAIATSSTYTDLSQFGMFALPRLEISTTNANLNMNFRAPLPIDIVDEKTGASFKIMSTKLQTRTVYRNGKPTMSDIGIIVKKSVKQMLDNVLAGCKAAPLDDPKLKAYYADVNGKNSPSDLYMIYLKLDTIPAFSQKDIDAFKANIPTKENLILAVYNQTILSKAIYQFSKLKKAAENANQIPKAVDPSLAGYSSEQLALISQNGIDIYHNNVILTKEKTADSENDGMTSEAEKSITWEFPKLKGVNEKANEKLQADINQLIEVLKQHYAAGDAASASAFVDNTKKAARDYAKTLFGINVALLAGGNFESVAPGILPYAEIVRPSKAGQTNTYLVIKGSDEIMEAARAKVSGYAVD